MYVQAIHHGLTEETRLQDIVVRFELFGGGELPPEVYRDLNLLFATRAGEQALDREYGIRWDAVDRNPAAARQLLHQEIMQKIAKYVPRAQVMNIKFGTPNNNGEIQVKVVCSIVAN
jgi:phage baseplate assembly protein W